MDLKTFNDAQRQALLDLAVLAMYADGHLSAAEHERVERLLTGMGLTSDYERAALYDASVSRVSRHSGTADAVRTHARKLAEAFDAPEQRKTVHGILHDLVASDSRIAPQESTFLATVREALQL